MDYFDTLVVDISKQMAQFLGHTHKVQIKENNKSINWAYYDEKNCSIIVSNFTQNDIGEHNLSIFIYDYWYSRYFSFSLTVIIFYPHPPAILGTIPNITAYQGQENVILKIEEGIFYDLNSNFSVFISFCSDVSTSSKDYQINFTDLNPVTYFQVTLNKNFLGSWKSNIIAFDLSEQASLATFYINVLKWPQRNWLYWNSPNIANWTEWIQGLVIDPSTREWKYGEPFFDKWIIISFTIVVLITTVISDHDVNASYILLESITLYWMLFSVFDGREWKIKQYFDEISIVITHFNSVTSPLFSWILGIENTEIKHTEYYLLVFNSFIY